MDLKRISNRLLFWTLIYFPYTDAESVRAVEGATVRLPCHSPPQDSVQVSVKWIQTSPTDKNICQFDFNKETGSSKEQCIPRFTLNRTYFTLNIENVQFSDAGDYRCITTKVIPPPVLENISEVLLQVEGLSLQLLNSSNESCVHLLCSLKSQNPELVNFTWSRDGQNSLNSFTSTDTDSELHLCKPDWSEGDTIICHANYSQTQTQTTIRLLSKNSYEKSQSTSYYVWISCSAVAGLILCIILIVVVCKCRKRHESGSIVFSNKVYENFSFAMSRQNTQIIDKPQSQPEECIYEN